MLIVDKNSFQAEVLEAEGYVLVDFYGEGCVPCEALMPDVVELSEKYADKVKFCKLCTTQARRLAIQQRVLGLPTVTLYKDGQKVAELTKEEATKDSIESMINNNIA